MISTDRRFDALHVTEAMTAGVLTFIASIANRQVEHGAAVAVLYSARSETVPREEIEKLFDRRVVLLPAVDRSSALRNALEMSRTLRRLAKSRAADAIHLHSAIAGAYGRLATFGTRCAIAYSPHGFPFLREDSHSVVRFAAKVVEALLARRGALVVTSASEVDIAAHTLRAPRVAYLRSGTRSEDIATAPAEPHAGMPRVCMIGRVSYQKAPWRYASVARQLSGEAEFIWIGDGPEESKQRWLGDAPVEVRGWLTADALAELLRATDVVLFPTLWEGMSLSLLQAQAFGIPVVTTDVVGNRDAVDDGTTGFVCVTDDELLEATRSIIGDADLRRRMGAAAREWSRTNFIDDTIGVDSLQIYAYTRSRRRRWRLLDRLPASRAPEILNSEKDSAE